MNIFVLSLNPVQAAKFHLDKHIVKMPIESAQLLSAAHHMLDSIYKDDVYKMSHKNNPLVLWAAASFSNYNWLLQHHIALLEEYTHRYGKIHKTSKILPFLERIPSDIPVIGRTPFHLSMPVEYKHSNPVIAYRDYYKGEKYSIARYTNRSWPYWFREEPSRVPTVTP